MSSLFLCYTIEIETSSSDNEAINIHRDHLLLLLLPSRLATDRGNFLPNTFSKNILRTSVNGTCKNFQPINTSDLTPPNAGDKIDVDKDVHFLLWTNENPTEEYEIVYNDLFSITNSPFQVSTTPPKNLSKFDNK